MTTVLCSWCPDHHLIREVNDGHDVISHGICDKKKVEVKAELERIKTNPNLRLTSMPKTLPPSTEG